MDRLQPLVSVIVPVYQAEQHLRGTLDSITGQDYRTLELLLVDDGSTDGSAALCADYAERDPRIKVLPLAHGGPSRARNQGMAAAQGAFFLFVDSDDPLEPGAISALVAGQAASNAHLVIGDFVKSKGGARTASGNTIDFSRDTLLEAKDIFVYVFERYLRKPNRHHLFVYVWGRLFRADVIREHGLCFDESLFLYEDVAFNFAFLRACHSPTILYLDRVLLAKTVVVHDGYNLSSALTATQGRGQFGYLTACKSIEAYLRETPIAFDYLSRLRHALTVYTIIQLIRVAGQWNSKNRKAITSLVGEIVHDPTVRDALDCYEPTGDDSRLIPWLMRHRLVSAVIVACRWKSAARYSVRGPATWFLRTEESS